MLRPFVIKVIETGHGTFNKQSCNVGITPERYIQFHWNCKQTRLKGKNSILNCEMFLPLFCEIPFAAAITQTKYIIFVVSP